MKNRFDIKIAQSIDRYLDTQYNFRGYPIYDNVSYGDRIRMRRGMRKIIKEIMSKDFSKVD